MSARILAIACGTTVALAAAVHAADIPAASFKVDSGPVVVTFDGKGQFHVDENQTAQVKGTYVVKGDEIHLTDVSGPWACSKSGEKSGVYHFKLDGSTLMFGLVSDKCVDRVNSIVNRQWERQ